MASSQSSITKSESVPTSTISKSSEQPHEKHIFECQICGLSEEYHYFGKKPPFCKSIVFIDDSYVMRDPFTLQYGNNANFLLLGGKCCICSESICQECSVFFTTRFCNKCYQSNIHLLPEELRVKKKKDQKD